MSPKREIHTTTRCTFLGLIIALAAYACAEPPVFHVQVIAPSTDPIGKSFTMPACISDTRWICGTEYQEVVGDYSYRAFRIGPAGHEILPLFTGQVLTGSTSAASINNSGIAVGWIGVPVIGGGYRPRMVAWETNAFEIGGLTASGLNYATDVNNEGAICGYSSYPGALGGFYHAVSGTTAGSLYDLGTMSGTNPMQDTSYAFGINESGTIVGSSEVDGGRFRAFRYEANMQEFPAVTGLPASYRSEAVALNDFDVATGNFYYISPASKQIARPAIMTQAGSTPIDVLERAGAPDEFAYATSINNREWIVGSSAPTRAEDGDLSKNLAWIAMNGITYDLNSYLDDPTIRISQASHVNNNGQITGLGLKGTKTVGLLLTPPNVTITGHVTFENYDPLPNTQWLWVELLQGPSVRYSTYVTPDAAGKFSFQTNRWGYFRVRVRGKHWLSKTSDVFDTSGGFAGLDFSLPNGDIDGDNSISLFDYLVLSEYFDMSSSDSNWETVGANGFAPKDADLDGDGAVSLFDYLILSENFDRSGD